jgi:drug/metabolite transporter (DMT)-like permease
MSPDPVSTPLPSSSDEDGLGTRRGAGSPASHRAADNVPAAAAYMVAGSALFVTLDALVKSAAREATPMQAVVYRSVLSAIPLLAMMRAQRIPVASPRLGLLALRGLVGFAALFCFMWGITHLHLADVLALQQLSPIFVAFLSVLLLGERPRATHWLLAGGCLLGALLVVQPTRGLVSLSSCVVLLSAAFSSVAYVTVRALTRTEPTLRIVAWFTLVGAVLGGPIAAADWRWLSPRANLLLAASGLLATAAQIFMTAAYRRAPAHVASAFSYANIPLAYLVGLVFFGEQPNAAAMAGIGLIVVGGVAVVLSMRA